MKFKDKVDLYAKAHRILFPILLALTVFAGLMLVINLIAGFLGAVLINAVNLLILPLAVEIEYQLFHKDQPNRSE